LWLKLQERLPDSELLLPLRGEIRLFFGLLPPQFPDTGNCFDILGFQFEKLLPSSHLLLPLSCQTSLCGLPPSQLSDVRQCYSIPRLKLQERLPDGKLLLPLRSAIRLLLGLLPLEGHYAMQCKSILWF